MHNTISDLYTPIFSFIKKRVNSVEDAEDITQDVFLKMSKQSIEGIENLSAWLYAIARNSIVDYYRKKKFLSDNLDGFEVPEEVVLEEANNELSRCIVPFIKQLPDAYRQVLTLSELEGISQKDIAKTLGTNYTTVRSTVQRGRKKLKEQFENCCNIIQGGKGSILEVNTSDSCNSKC